LSTIGKEKVDSFGTVQRAPAAETDYGIDVKRCGKRSARFDHSSVRVYFKIVKPKYLDSCPSQRRQSFIDMTGGNETLIGNEERATDPQFSRQLAKALDRASAEDEPSLELKFEGVHFCRAKAI